MEEQLYINMLQSILIALDEDYDDIFTGDLDETSENSPMDDTTHQNGVAGSN